MLDKIRYRLVYNRTNHLNKKGEALVQIECLLHGQRVFFSTNVYLPPECWEKGFVVNHPHAVDLNTYLYRSLLDIQEVELEFIRRGQAPTLLQLKNAVLYHISASASFADFVTSINEHSAHRGKHTRESYKTLIKHVEKFQKGTTLADIDLDFLNRFSEWSKQQGLTQSTVSGRLKNLRAIVNEAVARKLISVDDDPFKSFRIPKIKNRDESLTPDELKKLMSVKLRGRMAHIRDVFCFDCFCGFRYSDLVNLTEKDFTTINGKRWIVLATRKTGDTARVPIETIFGGRAMTLLAQYKSLSRFFRIGNNASANRTLKEVFRKAKIDKYAHFHLARHTFITLCIESGIPITTVQMMAAHSKIETTRNYAKLGISVIGKDVERIFGKKRHL
ncbi:MAG: site-specific integrase [Bacteroidaceae bacterium]|nr:site-specific integrase [Bacteroidaceae bacterium]